MVVLSKATAAETPYRIRACSSPGDDDEDVDLDDVINDIRYMHMMMTMAAVMLVSSQPALLCVIEDVDNDKKENH